MPRWNSIAACFLWHLTCDKVKCFTAVHKDTVSSSLPEDYQHIGDQLIRQACSTIAPDLQIDTDWKRGHIVVTLKGTEVFMSSPLEDGESLVSDDTEDDTEETIATTPGAVDVTTIARAINAALDCHDVGQAIATEYSIEVTTPGASDELEGDRMFSAYQGFDVICVYDDPKKKKQRTVEGRLVERNEQHLILNIKGRISKLNRENVLSVKLPKAKREKL